MPKVMFLALDIAQFYRNSFFNTNDLANLANRYKSDLVRQRKDKKDYRYLDDTRFGGLRGNFSTLLTWRGLVKRGSKIVSTYSLGKDGRLVNSVCDGKIILDRENFIACTNDIGLKNILETEAWLLNVREAQAHVKTKLKRSPEIALERDNINFPKKSVFISSHNQYFIRGMVNNFIGSKNDTLQFNIMNLWEGSKFRRKNLHPLIIIPTKENSWEEIYAIKNEDLYLNKPMLLSINVATKECMDKNGNYYKIYALEDAIKEFSKGDDNIEKRLEYSWDELKKKYCEKDVDYSVRKEDEFSNFLRIFLKWNRNFSIDGKDVADVKVISSGGPDVELIFSGGTTQKIELEHKWNSYLSHSHHTNNAFKNVWIFSEEKLDIEKIIKTFKEARKQNCDRIPEVFLGIDKNGERCAYKIDWDNEIAKKISLSF